MAELPPNDRLKTIGEGGRREWLYPEWLRGKFMSMRSVAHALLLVVLLIGPWIDVGGHPALRIDIVERRIYFWGLTLFATDGAYLLFLMGVVLFGVFLFTALFGRAWCGWSCPQTVFMESLVRPIERLIEGGATTRRRFDRQPWTWKKLARKLTKWAAFLVVAGAIATTFTAYFLGREATLVAQRDPLAHPAGSLTFFILTGLLFFDFAWFREQTCLVVCPYGRFQSVLMDADSLSVMYDAKRGEPRGKKNAQGVGDCVDCRKCVVVCPTGCDIRKGNQMECIQCMACIDACDDVMVRLKRPPGLIRFSSENAIEGKDVRVLRPRVLAYGAGLLAVVLAASAVVARRAPVELNLSRQQGAPYVETPDGRIQNPLRLRVANKSDEVRAFRLDPVAPEGTAIVAPLVPFVVAPGEVAHMPFFLHRARADVEGNDETVTLRVYDDHGFEQTLSTRFMTGGR